MDAGPVHIPFTADLSGLARGADQVEGVLGGIGTEADRARAKLGGMGTEGARGMGRFGHATGNANNFLLEFGRFTNDSIQFQHGFRQGLVATANQIDGLGFAFRQMQAAAAETGTTMRSQIMGSLKGPGGVILLLNVAATAAVLFGDRIVSAFNDGASAASNARGEIADALDALIKFRALERGFSFGSFAEGFAEQSGMSARLAIARQRLRDAEAAAGTSFAGSNLGTGSGGLREVQNITPEVTRARNAVADLEAGLADLTTKLGEYRRQETLADNLGAPSTLREAAAQIGRTASATRDLGQAAGVAVPKVRALTKDAAGGMSEFEKAVRAAKAGVLDLSSDGAGLRILDVEAVRAFRIESEGAEIAALGISRNLRDVPEGTGRAAASVREVRRETELAMHAAHELADGFGRAAVSLGEAGVAAIFGGGGATERDRRFAERDRERVREAFEDGRISAAEMRDEIELIDERLADLGATGLSIGSILGDVFGGLSRQILHAAAQALVLKGIMSVLFPSRAFGFVDAFTGGLGIPAGSLAAAPAASALAAPQRVEVVLGGAALSGGSLQIPVSAVAQGGEAGSAYLRRIGQR